MPKSTHRIDSAEFMAICKRNGLKVTPQRVAIFEAVVDLDTHPSADEVYRIVTKKFPTISFDTVNRTLVTFSELGIVDITESSSGIRRLDPDINNHHHIHCRKCGNIIDFYNKDFDELNVPKKLRNEYRIEKVRVTLMGICDACQRVSTSEMNN